MDVLTSDFPRGGDFVFPQDVTHNRSRRAEMYYLLTYGATVYDAFGIDQSNILSKGSLLFEFVPDGNGACDPTAEDGEV